MSRRAQRSRADAYTSHDLVAFHITARSTKGIEAADLLTDFVGRATLDPVESTRSAGRGAGDRRYNDQPSAWRASDRSGGVGEHPLGRPVLARGDLSETSRVRAHRLRERQWSRPGRRICGRQPRLGRCGSGSRSCSSASERPPNRTYDPAPTRPPRAGHRARLKPVTLRMSIGRQSIRPTGSARGADDLLDAAGARWLTTVRRDPRAARLCYSVSSYPTCTRTCRCCS